MLHPSLKFDREALADICRRYHIRELSIFGSATREDFGPDSDVDVLLEYDEHRKPNWDQHFAMLFELEAVFGRSVDLINGRKLIVNPYRRATILPSLERLYAA
jgi:predicted nucleotidyltransferase